MQLKKHASVKDYSQAALRSAKLHSNYMRNSPLTFRPFKDAFLSGVKPIKAIMSK
jgi:hypothetical protein